jgi:hypothetical protein
VPSKARGFQDFDQDSLPRLSHGAGLHAPRVTSVVEIECVEKEAKRGHFSLILNNPITGEDVHSTTNGEFEISQRNGRNSAKRGIILRKLEA